MHYIHQTIPHQEVKSVAPEWRVPQHMMHIIQLIKVIRNEIAQYRKNTGFFTIGMKRKADRIEWALNNAMPRLSQFASMDDFLNYKDDRTLAPSLSQAFSASRRWFRDTPLWGETASWLRIKDAMKKIISSPEVPIAMPAKNKTGMTNPMA